MGRQLPQHDELVQLLRRDPQAYEALRTELIDDLIDRAPATLKPRLRGLQFRIDGVRRLSHSSLGATVKLQQMMWESFLTLNQQLRDFPNLRPSLPPPISAKVLPLSRRDAAGTGS